MEKEKILRLLKRTSLVASLMVLLSCGGGGGGPTPTTTPAGANEVLISGRAAKGTILNATVRATQIINGQLSGTQKDVALGTNGDFSVSMPKGLVHLQIIPNANSTTQDEATGVAVALPPEFKFRAAADLTDTTATTVSLNITPYSEAGVALAEKSGGLTVTNINQANSGIANILGFDHLSTIPIQSSDTVALASATTNEKKLSVLNAAVSNMAATDALGCGVKATYGQTIDCTIAKLADQFQMNYAATVLPLAAGVVQSTTANSTPMVLLGDPGYQSLLGGIANAVGSGAAALKSTIVEIVQDGVAFSVSAATYAKVTVSTAINDSQRQTAWLAYQASIKDRGDLIISANAAYKYAVMSDLVYKAQPKFGAESVWTNGNHPDELLIPLNDRTGVYSAPDSYTVLNWQTYGIDPSVSSSVGMQWGIFFNNEEIVFAYRGTEPLSLNDWLSNLNDLTCLNPQYEIAKVQFDSLVTNPKFISDFLTSPKKRRIILTGHSLGGGIAAYIATWSNNSSIIDHVFGFNSAPLCSARALAAGANAFINDWKIHRIIINGEPVSALCATALVYLSQENPRLCRGDSRSLTFTGVHLRHSNS